MKKTENDTPKETNVPTRPKGEKPSFVRHRGSINLSQARAPNRPPAASAPVRHINPIIIPNVDAKDETSILSNQNDSPQFTPISPVSITQLYEDQTSPLPADITPFYQVLRAKVMQKLQKIKEFEVISEAESSEVSLICSEITRAIAEFKAIMQQDPTTFCRSSEGIILWTQQRHLAIKGLQNKIKPHFDRINQLLSQEEAMASPTKQLYSSPIGRRAASTKGQILESTPFGKILESTGINSMLKSCFGPTAFSSQSPSQTIYKEINGEIIEMQKGSVLDSQTQSSVPFTTNIDTAVVIGIWEAVSSSYAQASAEVAHIYVPFGIGANTVMWNHELPELRKNFTDEHIIIHTLSSPETYAELQRDFETKQQALKTAQANALMPSDVLFSLRLDQEDAQKKRDDYLNESKNWQHESFDKSHIQIVTRDKTHIPLQTMKKFVKKLRKNGAESNASLKSVSDTQSDSQSEEDEAGSFKA